MSLSRSKIVTAALLLSFVTACADSQGPSRMLPQNGDASTPTTARAAKPDSDDAVVADAAPLREAGARDAGPAPGGRVMNLAMVLKYRNQSELDALVQSQKGGGAGWLTNDQFNARFAPLERDYDRALLSLRSAGFRIGKPYANRTVIDFVGTVATIDRYFQTKIDDVTVGGSGTRVANVKAARVSTGLQNIVLAVGGLSTLPLVHTFHHFVPPGSQRRVPHSNAKPGWPLFGPPSTSSGAQGYGPRAFTAAYDLPNDHAGGSNGHYDGAGRTAAIVIDADYTDGDLNGFLKYFKIKRSGSVARVLINHGPPPGDESVDSIEATLDIETIASLLPGSNVLVYEIPSLSDGDIIDAYNKAASDNKADAVNSSFGGCESLLTKTAKAWSAIAEQALAKGMTFSASTGDGGGRLCQNAPSDSPFVAAIGGTALEIGSSGVWQGEVAWAGGGGGISTLFGLPAWQAGVANANPRGRNLPDVSFDADPESGAAFFYTNSWNTNGNPIGGTSLSSPIFVAAVTQMDQVVGSRLGLTGAGLFGEFASTGYGPSTAPVFHDVTLGNNNIYYALTGYDQATGIGSIDAWNVAQARLH